MLKGDEIELVENVISQLKSKGNIEIIYPEIESEFIDYIRKSILMNSYKDVRFHKLVKIPDSGSDSRLLIVEVSYSFQTGKYANVSSETQLVGFKKLDFNYGHILIRPETIADKLSEIFNKSEIDFKEHPKFSSKYYFLSDDESLAHSFANSRRLELMERQREIQIEINGDKLISKYSRRITPEDCENMIEFIQNI